MESHTEGHHSVRGRAGSDDADLVARLLRHDGPTEDHVTARLREMLERVARRLEPSEQSDDLTVSVLYEILQAEERVLAGWDASVPFLPYLAVVGARVSLDEQRRWVQIRGEAEALPDAAPVSHLSDLMLAMHVANQADDRVGGQVLQHLAVCERCEWIASAARFALDG
jgi:hypothetical protein